MLLIACMRFRPYHERLRLQLLVYSLPLDHFVPPQTEGMHEVLEPSSYQEQGLGFRI